LWLVTGVQTCALPIFQEFFCTFEAKPAILKPVMHEFENYAFGVFQSDKNRDFPA